MKLIVVLFLAQLMDYETQLKNRPILSVQDSPYRAVGNGVIDDTAAVNAAITAAGERYTIKFPNGKYVLGNLISPAHPITLDFTGSIILVKTNSDMITFNTNFAEESPMIVKGGMFQAFPGYTPTNVFRINGANNTVFEKIVFSQLNFSHGGIWNQKSFGTTLKEVRASHTSGGPILYMSQAADLSEYSYQLRILDSDFSGHTGLCIMAEGGTGFSIKDSIVESCTGGGIKQGNQNLHAFSFDNLHLENNTGHHIEFSPTPNIVSIGTISNSIFNDTPNGEAVKLGWATYLNFKGNWMYNSCLGGTPGAINGRISLGTNLQFAAGVGCDPTNIMFKSDIVNQAAVEGPLVGYANFKQGGEPFIIKSLQAVSDANYMSFFKDNSGKDLWKLSTSGQIKQRNDGSATNAFILDNRTTDGYTTICVTEDDCQSTGSVVRRFNSNYSTQPLLKNTLQLMTFSGKVNLDSKVTVGSQGTHAEIHPAYGLEVYTRMALDGIFRNTGKTLAELLGSGLTNGEFVWCKDCTPNTNPCTGSGPGAWMFVSNANVCPF